MRDVIVLLSGGVDSAVLAAKALRDGRLRAGLSFNYGQAGAANECSLAKRWCEQHQVEWLGLMLPATIGRWMRKEGVGGPGPRVVPARNAIFASCAASFAVTMQAPVIWYGATADDAAEYPDCRAEWVTAMSDVLHLAAGVRLEAPLVQMSKAEVVALGNELGVDWTATWSCYQPRRDLEPCGTCNACVSRNAVLPIGAP